MKLNIRSHLDGSTTIEISDDDAYTLLFTPEQALDLLDQRKGELTRLVNAAGSQVIEDLDDGPEHVTDAQERPPSVSPAKSYKLPQGTS